MRPDCFRPKAVQASIAMEFPESYTAPDPTTWRIHMSARDFKDADERIEAAQSHPETSFEHEALLEIAILRYARPFTGNERDPRALADSRLSGVKPQEVLLAEDVPLHDRILTLRSKVVAHSEAKHNPMRLVDPFAGEPGLRSAGFVSRRWHVVNEHLDLAAFARICRAMHVKCLNLLVDRTRR
jgi:hypothetical protein